MRANRTEQRRHARSRVFYGAEIVRDADLPPVSCHIKNVSRGGARIVVQSGDLLPSQFYIAIRKTDERRPAIIAWKCGRDYGVAFRGDDA
jgi:hypothetical protein